MGKIWKPDPVEESVCVRGFAVLVYDSWRKGFDRFLHVRKKQSHRPRIVRRVPRDPIHLSLLYLTLFHTLYQISHSNEIFNLIMSSCLSILRVNRKPPKSTNLTAILSYSLSFLGWLDTGEQVTLTLPWPHLLDLVFHMEPRFGSCWLYFWAHLPFFFPFFFVKIKYII